MYTNTEYKNTNVKIKKEYTIEFQIESWKRSGSESAPAASIHSWWAVHIAKKSTLTDLILRFSEQKGDKNLLKIRFIFVQVISNKEKVVAIQWRTNLRQKSQKFIKTKVWRESSSMANGGEKLSYLEKFNLRFWNCYGCTSQPFIVGELTAATTCWSAPSVIECNPLWCVQLEGSRMQ